MVYWLQHSVEAEAINTLKVLCEQFNEQHRISVYDTSELYGEKGSFRVLQFSETAVQGVMDLSDPARIVFEYPRAMIHLMKYNNPSFDNVFMIGLGIGTIAGHFSEKRFKIAELNEKVWEISKKYFGFGGNQVDIGDGRRILEREGSHAYDYVVLDAFTPQGTPMHLLSKQFFKIVKEKLSPQGAVIMNLTGRGENDRLLRAIHTTIGEVFPYTRSFALPSKSAAEMRNVILMGRSMPIAFQGRKMAGFTEIEFSRGHIILDNDA